MSTYPRLQVQVSSQLHQHLAVLTAIVVAGGAVGAAWLIFRPFGFDQLTLTEGLTAAAAILAAALLLRAGAASRGRARTAWFSFGAGIVLWAIGETYWVADAIVHGEAAFPSAGDAAFLAGYGPLIFGGILIASPSRSWARARAALDSLAVVLGGTAIVWRLVLQPAYNDSESTLAERLIGSAYPLGDLVLFFALMLAVTRHRRGWGALAIGVLAAGLVITVVADSGFTYLSLHGDYDATALNYAWTLGYLAMAYAAVLQTGWPPPGVESEANRAPSAWRQAVPLGLLLVLVGFAGYHHDAVAHDRPFIVMVGLALLAIVVREVAVLHDNAGLNLALAHAGETLEARVRERTQELARLVSILEATTDYVGTYDTEGKLLYLNQAGRRMIGIGEEADIDRLGYSEYHPPWAIQVIKGAALPAALRDGSWNGETAFLAADGTEIPVSQLIIAHRWDDGSPRYFSTIARDITERKHMENEILQSQKLESLGVLAGGVAHDFNNLLTVILGNANLAQRDVGPGSAAAEAIREIETASQRGAELAKRMLTYSGKGAPMVQPFDLNSIVEETAHLLLSSLGSGCELVQELAPVLPPVTGDPTQIRQVLMNLVVNASEAIENGAGRIRLRTGVTHAARARPGAGYVDPGFEPGDYVYVEVTDNGSGMDAKTRARIFDPFFTTKFTGRGLGLAASLGIVRAHRGTVRVKSAPGAGTTFRVLLPVAVEAAEPAASA